MNHLRLLAPFTRDGEVFGVELGDVEGAVREEDRGVEGLQEAEEGVLVQRLDRRVRVREPEVARLKEAMCEGESG